MYTNQLANWHLINMGAANDVQSIHFHGQTFLNHQSKVHRQGVYPLLPGLSCQIYIYFLNGLYEDLKLTLYQNMIIVHSLDLIELWNVDLKEGRV